MGKFALRLVALATLAIVLTNASFPAIRRTPFCKWYTTLNYRLRRECDLGAPFQPPSRAFKLKVRAFYDDDFQRKFGGAASSKIDSLLRKTQYYFTRYELKYRFNLEVNKTKTHVKGSYPSDDGSLKFFYYLAGRDEEEELKAAPNVYLMMTAADSNRPGITTDGGVCTRGLSWRSAVVTYFRDDSSTAENIAHEIGHLLGLKHDDEFTTEYRQQRCDRMDSIMRDKVLKRPAIGWTTCSRRDVKKSLFRGKLRCLIQQWCTDLLYNGKCKRCDTAWYVRKCRRTCNNKKYCQKKG